MFEKLGSRKYAVPLVAAIVIACVMSLIFYPMANLEMKGLPFAVLSLDEGVETPQGTMNAGDAIVENMLATSEDGEGASPIAWTRVESQQELDAALENGEFYGALVVPAGFSADQAAAKQAETQAMMEQAQAALAAAQAQAAAQAAAAGEQGQAASAPAALGAAAQSGAEAGSGSAAAAATEVAGVQAPSLRVVIDNAKSPLVANQMKASIATMFQQLGVDVEVETIHAGDGASSDEEAPAANPMAGMMSQQLTVMPLFVMSMVGAIVLSRVFKTKPGASRTERWKSLGIQAAYAVAVSLIASLCVYGMLLWVAGSTAPMTEFVLFAWFASLCVMLLFLGAFNVSIGLGVLVAFCALAFGMMCGTLPYEALPTFWQDWAYPWAPQRFLGEGLRAVMFLDAGAWNVGSGPLAIFGVVGLALAGFAGIMPRRGEAA